MYSDEQMVSRRGPDFSFSLGGIGSRLLNPLAYETKQIQTMKLGAEKGFLQGQARRMGGPCSKDPNSLVVFGEEFL